MAWRGSWGRLVNGVARALVANHVAHSEGALSRAPPPVDLGW